MTDDALAPVYCLNCGGPIPKRSRIHGHPPKTCSEKCRKERASRKEKERYHKVKNTESWRETRSAYLSTIKKRLASDPEYAAIFRAYGADRTREWVKKLRESDPSRYSELLEKKRAERAKWRESLVSDPAAWEAHKEKARAWYRSLSPEDRDRIFHARR